MPLLRFQKFNNCEFHFSTVVKSFRSLFVQVLNFDLPCEEMQAHAAILLLEVTDSALADRRKTELVLALFGIEFRDHFLLKSSTARVGTELAVTLGQSGLHSLAGNVAGAVS